MENFIKANLIRSDLVEIDRQLSDGFHHDMSTMLLVKQVFLTITNLVDFELTIRLLYKEYPQLSEKYQENARNYDFSKYLRNKFVGHIKPELITKAIEWRLIYVIFTEVLTRPIVLIRGLVEWISTKETVVVVSHLPNGKIVIKPLRYWFSDMRFVVFCVRFKGCFQFFSN